MSSNYLPKLPTRLSNFIPYLTSNTNQPINKILEPFKSYEAKLRELYAQEPGNKVLNDPYINTVPLFNGAESDIKIRARNLQEETDVEKSKYIIPLSDKKRKPNGSPAVVSTLKDFQYNFSIFTEQSLAELDWSNVVAAGSSALTPLLPIPQAHNVSKRSIRNYYHNTIAPASDVDLFLYGLNEEQALEKIKQIERAIKDSILAETTTIRTKNAITIASQYPVRHVQIVLRIYKSVSEILTGFDVDSSCVAYDGKEVYATPRAIAALSTQINQVDLTRRSPSYESRLSKYSHRGFEIYWPQLDRSKVDPTIFERSFPRTVGLARLLVLEQLPKDADRVQYNNQRRVERGRPPVHQNAETRGVGGDMKGDNVDEVADWIQEDQISNYHSFTIPYGPRIHARRIEKLLYTKDLLLNAEWNTKSRKIKLHRHPAFFGEAEHVFEDCCGFCPIPETEEEILLAEEESKNYVSGKMTFITDDPGRQAIGSFNPIVDTDWTDMAYVSDTGRLCQAVVDCDLAAVQKCIDEGIDVNKRDYVGRTVLHLATSASSPEVVKCLLDNGAYIVPRIADGQTALHLACVRGDVDILNAIFDKNEENKAAAEQAKTNDKESEDEMDESSEEDDSDDDEEASTAGSEFSAFLKIETVDQYMKKTKDKKGDDQEFAADVSKILPKDDILDVDIPAWDSHCTPVHLATIFGNVETLKMLFEKFGADARIPVKLMRTYNPSIPRDAILSLVLALGLPVEQAENVVQILTANGARSSQASLGGITVYDYFVNNSVEMLKLLYKYDSKHAKLVLNHLSFRSSYNPTWNSPLRVAIENRDVQMIEKLLELGAEYQIEHDDWLRVYKSQFGRSVNDYKQDGFKSLFLENTQQPIILAVQNECPQAVKAFIEAGADINTLNTHGQSVVDGIVTDPYNRQNKVAQTVLDVVREKIRDLAADTSAASQSVPQEPEGLDALLDDVEPGTYNHWFVTEYIRKIKEEHDEAVKTQGNGKEKQKEDNALRNKLKMIQNLLDHYKSLETYLVDKGAKTFGVLHLDYKADKDEDERVAAEIRARETAQRELVRKKQESRKHVLVRSYDVDGLSNDQKAEYLELFEAAWNGDFERIQELTTKTRGQHGEQPPLTITVNDSMQHSPWDIALLRGHVDVAIQMLDIVQAQYAPQGKEASYVIGSEDDDSDENDSVSDSENGGGVGLRLYERLPASVRDRFTIEDIGELSTTVKGESNPVEMFQATLPLRSFVTISKVKAEDLVDHNINGLSADLFCYAMIKNDLNLFKRFMDTAIKYQQYANDIKTDDDRRSTSKTSILHDDAVRMALRAGKPQFLAVMIARTGAGISFDDIIKKSGGEVVEKSQYYRGLSIRGVKNKQWAQADRNKWTPASSEERPLLLRACLEGSIESVEWLLSDAPLRVYCDFAAANKDEESIKVVSNGNGGFENQIGEWLNSRRELALHCVVMGSYKAEKDKLISYLIKAVPESLNAKSAQGRTPLMLAFALRLPSVAKLLIDAGADIEATDRKGNNILHALFTVWRYIGGWIPHGAPRDHQVMKTMLNLLDGSTVKNLLLKRNAYSEGAQTPLQGWLSSHGKAYNNNNPADRSISIPTLNLLLSSSGPEALSMISGNGDTPVHSVVSAQQADYLTAMLDFAPDCIFRENAVGRTPAEVARALWLGTQVQEPPIVGLGAQEWNAPENKRPLLSRSIGWFDSCGAKKESKEAEIWRICRERMEAGMSRKRKLVSLAEANEVAKRLADSQRVAAFRRGEQSEGAEKVDVMMDEVEAWFHDDVKANEDED